MNNSQLPNRSECFMLIWNFLWMAFLLESIIREQIKDSLNLREFLTIKKTIEFFFYLSIMKPIFQFLNLELLARQVFFVFFFFSLLGLLPKYSINKLALFFFLQSFNLFAFAIPNSEEQTNQRHEIFLSLKLKLI